VCPNGDPGGQPGASERDASTWTDVSSTDHSYAGDNRLVLLESSYRREGSAPRCRLSASWGCTRSQGSGCSPGNALRELGSERRESVRFLSGSNDEHNRGRDTATLVAVGSGLGVPWARGEERFAKNASQRTLRKERFAKNASRSILRSAPCTLQGGRDPALRR